ncbi:MAG: UV DNA damage repair endonuclease UvsE [bacterium]|nr:UV DNA damage repair endonuclease UvsE [bacterium]
MRIGYPCVNLSIGCTSARTFRLRSYSAARLAETVRLNLDCLLATLIENDARGVRFFRISSDLVPFASHPVCRLPWRRRFRDDLAGIGAFISARGMRVSMHPDRFTLINSPDRGVFLRSARELRYHADLLDAMGLDDSAKIQIHVGGVYGDRPGSIARFLRRHAALDGRVRRRLAIENDEGCYPAADCLAISRAAGVPVVLDVFHHRLLNRGEALRDLLPLVARTWRRRDGLPIVDYSCQEKGARRGAHARSLCERDFNAFLRESRPHDFDLMLEIKDKERSALRALRLARDDRRLAAAAGA